MIGRLRGMLVMKQPPWLVVDVNGVGYELEAPMSTFYDLPDLGREVALFTHYAQKEDSVSLYGFLRESERRLLRVGDHGHACEREVSWLHEDLAAIRLYLRHGLVHTLDGHET